MRLLASGDHHFDEHSRWDECLRVHSWIAERVETERPDVFLSGGDLYERASTPREREAVAAWLHRIAETCPVIIAKGNHEKPLDVALLSRLDTQHKVHVVEDAQVVYIGDAAIAVMAWPSSASLAAATHYHDEPAGGLERSALTGVLRGLGHELADHPGPRIALGHWMIDGSVTSVGQPLIGHSMNVGLEDLGLLQAHLVLGSHIHKSQEWTWNGAPIAYMGSPYRTSFGETEEKSIVLAELDDTGLVRWERVPTPCAGMLLVEDEWDEGGWAVGDGVPENASGAEIRLRWTVDADKREAARTAAERFREACIAAGAIAVKLDERVRPTTRARAPEVATATTLADKLAALWNSRSTTPAADRAERLQRMAAELEQENAA